MPNAAAAALWAILDEVVTEYAPVVKELPLTFVTGFFGQNFEWLVGHINSLAAFLIYGLGGLALPMVLLFWWLKHRKPQKDPEGMPVSPGWVRDGKTTPARYPTGTALPRRQLRRETT
jgi:cyanate permease